MYINFYADVCQRCVGAACWAAAAGWCGAAALCSALRWFQVFSYFTVFVLLFSEGAGQWPPAVQVVVPAVPTLDTQIQQGTCGARHCA